MKVILVMVTVENLGIECLSSFLKKAGHEVEIIFDPRLFNTEVFDFKSLSNFFDTSAELACLINEKKPDLVGFSPFTFSYQRCLCLARQIKKINHNIPIIFGGTHPTILPELVIKEDCVDIICIGEGEYALKELLESMEKGKVNTAIKNLWFKKGKKVIKNPLRPLITNLDILPWPDKEQIYKIYPDFVINDYYTASSRGCPFACTYCGNSVFREIFRGLGKVIRKRSPENVVDELVWAKEKFKIKRIAFVDDVFGDDIDWLKQFAKAYKKKVNLPYVMITHPLLLTEGIAKLLSDSGCNYVLFGIQSASEKTRREVLNRHESNESIKKASLIMHKYNLKFSVDHIFNIPTEGLSQQEEAVRLYNEIRPTTINSYWLQYFPKTPIIDTAIKNGIIKKKDIYKINQGFTNTSVVVGLGNKDSFNPDLVYTNFQLFFLIMPFLPKRFTDWIIKKRYYLLPIKPPLTVNVIIKFFIHVIKDRGQIYWGILKVTGHFMIVNLSLKFKYRKFLKNS